ncbi:MAG TPA: AfsA-related hotdog domain-containing protein [Cellvibrio sp.]|nr:AfsA-related hotdog domain-containing protein [Cellvibrio sp.]
MSKRLLIVGDQFGDFCTDESTITVKNFSNSLNTNIYDGYEVILGQGIKHDTLQLFNQLNATRNINVFERAEPASLEVTHKHDRKNIMISQPQKKEDGIYHSEFMLNDESDRLIDHVTGKHISGMAMVEAARQASIACSEIEFKLQDHDIKQGFIWKGMSVDFQKFTFPVPTNVNVEVVLHEGSTNKKLILSTVVTFTQNKESVCVIKNDFEIIAAKIINQFEVRSAEKIIRDITLNIDAMDSKKCAA